MKFTSINGHSLKDDGTVPFGCPVYKCSRCGHSATYGNFTQMDCVPSYTIVALTVFPDGERHYNELETSLRVTFDRIVSAVFESKFRKAAYLIDAKGRLIDSYVKD